ncbi:hypothetical protein Tco_0416993 [Tanacetum coccineum]
MASLDYRLNHKFKECSSCGALYTKDHCCSKGGLVDKFVRDPNNISDSSQRPPHNCPNFGDPVDGLYCRQCALLRKKLREIFDENEFFQDFLNTSEASNDNTNIVNAPQEPFFLIILNPEPCNNQTIDELPQTLPSFDPTCYSGDGSSFTYDSTPNFVDDSPNVINPPPQPPTYSYEICGNDAHYGHDCPPQHAQPKNTHELLRKLLNDVKIISEELAEYINTLSWNRPIVYYDDDDDEDYTIAITPVLSTEELVNSLNYFDACLLEEFAGELALIAPIPPGIVEADLDPKRDIYFIENLMYDNSFPRPPETLKDDFETVIDSNNDYSLSDDNSYEDIDYVDASPPDSELVSLEEVKDFHTKDGEIEDDVLCEKLSKINLLIAKIEALNANPPPSSDFVTKSPSTFLHFFLEETNTVDNSLPESETFCFDLEENSSGSTTTRSDYSLPDYEAFYFDREHFKRTQYDCFYFKSEPDSGELTSIVDPRIHENVSSTTNVNLPFKDEQSTLFAYVIALDFEASRARGFVLRSLELQFLSFILGIQYPNLID